MCGRFENQNDQCVLYMMNDLVSKIVSIYFQRERPSLCFCSKLIDIHNRRVGVRVKGGGIGKIWHFRKKKHTVIHKGTMLEHYYRWNLDTHFNSFFLWKVAIKPISALGLVSIWRYKNFTSYGRNTFLKYDCVHESSKKCN